MDVQGRGWRKEYVVVLKDLVTGEEVPVFTGLTLDLNSDSGRLVSVLAVGDGRTLVLGDKAGQLRVNVASTDEDLKDSRRAGR